MACLDMYNSEHKMGHHSHSHGHSHSHNHHLHHHSHLMASPRISFSNDFVDAQQAMRQELMRSSRPAPSDAAQVPSDFEFSVSNYSMMSADELFFKGRLLPYKENNAISCGGGATSSLSPSSSARAVTTLRDELLHGDHDVTSRPAKGSSWKSLLGLKRAQHGGGSNSKKAEKSVDCAPRTLTMLGHQNEAHVSKTSQDWSNEDEIGL